MINTTPTNERRKAIRNKPKKESKKAKIWKFLNSNLFLLILGSVIIAGISNYISSNIQENQNEILQRKEVNRYNVELQFRNFRLNRIADTLILLSTYSKFIKLAKDTQKTRTDIINYKIKLKKEIDDIINGCGSYRPSDNSFKDQHLISILSWFSFNMGKHRLMDNEIGAVYRLQGEHILKSTMSNDTTTVSNINILMLFGLEVMSYVNDQKVLKGSKATITFN